IIILSACTIIVFNSVFSQGCVPIRNLAGFGQFAQLGYGQSNDKWLLDINNRYFQASQVYSLSTPKPWDGLTIYTYTTNFGLSRMLNNGWSISLDVPISANSISSIIEHRSGFRHTTSAFGLSDIRFTVYKWLFHGENSQRGNIQLGVGIKFPTGSDKDEDYFYTDPTNPKARTLAPVNVAIQLGDGGTGFTTEINGFYFFNKTISVHGDLFYLINPRDQNGVPSLPPGFPASTVKLFDTLGTEVNSVPDAYTVRAGADFTFNQLVATAGLRYEGVPAHDLIGKDDGLRRPGHIFSVEPGVQYKFKKSFLYSFVTVPVMRSTVKAPTDAEASAITGTDVTTTGHYANIVFFIGYTFTF
ncbi:MAG TPA: hypothetical protein VK787_10115, partial [Puia sp.]|nr:hypothetical protein [Puia sp.]